VTVELLNCDCMTFMKEQPDNSFDRETAQLAMF